MKKLELETIEKINDICDEIEALKYIATKDERRIIEIAMKMCNPQTRDEVGAGARAIATYCLPALDWAGPAATKEDVECFENRFVFNNNSKWFELINEGVEVSNNIMWRDKNNHNKFFKKENNKFTGMFLEAALEKTPHSNKLFAL